MKSNFKLTDGDFALLLFELIQSNNNQFQRLTELLKKQSQPTSKNMMDAAEFKQEYHISDSTIYRLRKNGKISFVKLGKKYYYSRKSIEKLLNDSL